MENKKLRPIIIRFVRYNDRKKVFLKKKNLKMIIIVVIESLTATRVQKLRNAREMHNFKNVSRSDRKILYKMSRVV